jgi:putative addiction module component (TIGR02574 family)
MKVTAADVLDLPVSERIQLVADIWESIAAFPEEIELTEATRELLRKRMVAHRVNPDAGSPWEDMRKRIVSR